MLSITMLGLVVVLPLVGERRRSVEYVNMWVTVASVNESTTVLSR